MLLRNREEAARLLARRLARYRRENPVILAIPRGAVPMARIIAAELHGEVDVALVRKIGAPGNPEYALGSVDERGGMYLHPGAEAFGRYIQEERDRQLRTLVARRRRYTPVHPPVPLVGRVVILVDDGVATGATMMAALQMAKEQNPKELIAAAAIMPPDTMALLGTIADEVVTLDTPTRFSAVSEFFREFPQVSDEDVIAMLR